ncbi:cadherin domain-containing protein, partial [Flavobacteriaceae bacterium]|nr:cadherin domain-containing protein [Flavobacteriaceae bacterium]
VDNSGSGGGATDIRQQGSSLADRIYVAGGGGGGARHRSSYRGGNGGAGGGLIGAQGGNGVYQGGGGNGGSGGSQSQGGNINGVLGAGGDGYYNQGNNQYTSSGSGGGGYYGGGRGHAKRYKTSGGGGGGSSYTNNSATNVIHTQGYINATENGGLTITSILNPQRILSTYTSSALFNDVLFRAVINGVTTPAVSITVLNSTPTDISLSSSSVEENVSTGTTVGGFTSTDVDAGDTFTYTLVDGDGATDNASFSISGANLLTAAALDFETKSSYSIRVQTSDGTASYEKSFSITVTDVNDAPTDIRFITNTAAVKTTDLILYLDAANPNSYSGSGTTWNDLSGNGNDFTIYGATHNTAGYFDFDGTDDWARSLSTLDLTAYESISVQVYLKSENTNQTEISYEHSANWNSNTGGFGLAIHSNGGPFTLNVHHTNHNAGVGARNYQATVGSNWHTNTNIFSVKADASGRLTYVNGLLTPLNGSTTTQNGTFLNDYFYLASRGGSSLFFNGQVKTLLIYGSKLSQEEVSNNFDLITNTSSSSLVSSNAITVDENTALNTLITSLAVTDEDLNDTHSFSLVNGVGEIGRDNDSVTVSGTQLLVNAAIDYESTPYLLLNILVSDGSSSYTSSFTITVNDINEGVPSDISLSNTAFFEDIALGNAIASLTVVDPDTSATHTYTLIDSGDAQDDDNNLFSVNGTTLVSSGTFDFETKNSYNIYLSVTDGLTSYEEAFTLTVSDTNEAPTEIIVTTGSNTSHVSDNLLLYLDARNANSYSGSGSTWNDLSGNNLDFTINGDVTHDSTNGFQFDTGQTSKYMIRTAFPHPTTTFTDEFYIKTSRTSDSTWKSYNVIGNDNQSSMFYFNASNNLYFGLPAGDFYTGIGFADGNWHHLVRTSNRTTGKEIIYLDGVEVYQSTTQAGSLVDTNGIYVIGQEQDSPGGGFDANQAFDGYLPVVRMYNSVLSADEVAQNYAAITNDSSLSTSTSDLLVVENAAIGTLIANLAVVDQDSNNTHTFSMVDGLGDIGRDNASVTVSGTQLIVNGTVDYEASPYLLVNVGVNDGVNTFTSSFTIVITDISAPTDIDLSTTVFQEDTTAGTAIATLTAVNVDANFNNHIFSLATSTGTLDEDNGSFIVSGTSLVTSGTFDYETKSSYNIYLKVTDGMANYFEAFTLTVSDTNEPPTGINFAYPFVDENVPLGTSVFGLSSSSQSGEGYINYKSYKTHNGNGSNSTFDGYTYSGLADSVTELEAMLDTNYSGTTLTHSGETEAYSSAGFIDGRAPHWSSSYYAVLHYGWFQAQETGTYTFEISSDDGSALWIDGVPIIFRPCCGSSTVNVSLTSDQWYYFETKWQEYTGGDYMRLRYRTPSSSSYKYVGADPNTLKVTNVEPIFDVLTTTDPDTGNIHTYSLVAGEGDDDNGSFTVSGTSLVTAAELDYETKNSYTVRLETFDGVNSFSDAFVITIQDINDNAPMAMALSTSTLNEDILSGTLVAEISTTDTDTNDVNEFTYSLVAGDGTNDSDNGHFTINGTSLVSSGTYDFEPMSDPNLYILIEVNDGSFTYSQTFIIGVVDRDDSPTDIALDNTAIFENIPLATAIASLTTEDQNPGDTHTYSLVATNSMEDDDNGSFTVSGTQLLTNAEFDFETKNTYKIYLQVSDGTGTRDYYEAFTITVSDTNEAPTEIDFAGGAGSTSGGGGTTSATGLIVHLDASNAASTATPNSRWIDLSGNENHGDILAGVSFQNNVFKTTNTGGERSGVRVGPLPTILNAGYSFTVVVKVTPQSTSGNILGLASDSQHGSWNAPVIPSANSKVFPGLHNAHGQFQRPFDIGTTYEYVYSYNHTNSEHKFYENGELVNTRTVGFGAANTPGYLFLGDDNPGCCGNYEGVHSADFVGDFHRFMVYNQVLTDQQIAGLYQSASFDENAAIGSVVGDLFTIDQDTDNSYIYTLVNGDGTNDINNTSFTVSGTQLIVNELFDYESIQELYINVQVNDGLNTLTDSVTIQINDVNDNAPTAMAISTNTLNEDIVSGTVVSVVSSTDADTDAVNNFTYSLVAGDGTNDQHNNRFVFNGNSLISSGTFDFEAVIDPTIYLNLEVNDGLFTYTQAVTLSLLNTNDAPTDIALSNTTIFENIPLATAIASLTTEDQNTGDIHTFSLTATNSNEDDDNGSFTISGTQLLTNDSFDFETKNSYNIYLKVSDGTGTIDYYEAFTITVSNVNEAPTSINIMPDGVSLDGLVVHLDAGNTSSYPGTGNTWYDLSGNGNHFNKNTATFVNSGFGYMDYNGSYSHSINSISSAFEDGYTAIILMKYNSFSGGSFQYNSSSSYINFYNGGRNSLRWETNGGNAISSQNTLNTNEWYLFAGTHEGITSMNQSGSAKIYINGTLDRDVNLTANPSTNAVMKLGEYAGAMNGSISAFLFYNRELTADEITEVTDFYSNRVTGIGSSSSSGGGTVEENASIGTLISELTVSDEDTNNTHLFSLVDGAGDIGRNNASVTVSGTQLLVNGTIDYESTPYLLVNIQVTDGSNSLTSSFTINVTDLNDTAPTAIGLSTTTFAEDIASGSVVATLSATDIDTASLNSFSYSLVSGDGINDASNSKFIISGNTLVTSGTSDYETAASHAIYLQVNDGANTFNQAFTLSITDQNDTPTDIDLSANAVDENLASGTVVGGLSTTDADNGNTFTYTLVGGGSDNDRFSISGAKLVTAAELDFETQNSYSVVIQTSDGSSTYSKTFTITVNNANDTPTDISLSANAVDENLASGTVVGGLSTTDDDSGDTFTYTLVGGGSDNDSFSISGTNLVTAAVLDFETQNSYSVVIQTSDGSSTYSKTFTIAVNNTNDSPTDISLSQTVFFEGIVSGSTLATITTTDQDTADTHTFTLVSSGDAQDDDNASFTVSGTSLITNDTLDFETKSTYALYLEVNDGTSQYTEAFSLTVSDTNDTAPTAIGLSTTTFAEDIASGSVVATLSATDIDTASLNSFSYSLVSGDGINDASNSKFIISGNTLVTSGTFDYETAASHAIYLQVNDGANTFNQAFTLSITDLNEVPTDISLSSGSSVTFSNVTSINDNEALNAIIGTLQTTDEDQNETFTYTLVNGNGINDSDNTLFTLNGNQLILNTNLDYKLQTSVNINMQVSDGTNFFIKSFSFAIIDKTGPRLSALSIADDNRTIAVQFDEAAFSTPSAVGSLTALDFNVSSTGGTASLTSNIPNSVTFDGTQYILGLTIQGATTGDETVLVNVAPNAVFDALGNAASGLQNNTITLHGDA